MTQDTSKRATDYKSYFQLAIDYSTYKDNFQNEISIGDESKFAEYLPQNWQRQSRIDRKLHLNDDLQSALARLENKLYWLVITEHWCGDASQINPVINKVAEESKGKIDLRFIYRDAHEELIDAHLTDGRSRSIPILLQLDEHFNFISSYGPRPEEAQLLVKSILTKGEAYNIPLHTWYAKNKQQDIQYGLTKLLTD